MKKGIVVAVLLFVSVLISSFAVHKFYMAIYQINYAPEKKMLQITSRIFVDDLNKTLEKKYSKKFFLGTNSESVESVDLLKKYLTENFTVKINGQFKNINFLSKEMDGDVLVCYTNARDVPKINSIEIHNSLLIDCFDEQQNITHVTAFGTKKSLLFTETSTVQVLKY
jgi:hypothetical protein